MYSVPFPHRVGGLEPQPFGIKRNTYTKAEKKKIANEIYPVTKDEALADYHKLEDVDLKTISPFARVGNKFVDYFTFPERIDTVGKANISYFDILANKDLFAKKPYIKRLIDYLKKNSKQKIGSYKMWKQIFNVYFSSISIFKPLNAMEIYTRYNPKSVLDFTMGWGGRLVGACALDVPNYIGIDLNKDLEAPYKEMVKTLNPMTSTKITLMFKDALAVDYSKLNYDMVFTSPPYYNIEIYQGTKRMTKDDWDNDFYRPIFQKTFQHLKKGGHFCLNIPDEVYERVCVKLLGKANEKIPLKKATRAKGGGENYKEFIYVWVK